MKKIFVIIASFSVVLLVAAEIYVQSGAFARRLRPYVVAPLQEILGKDAEIGWVRANLIPLFIEARDVSLPDGKGGKAATIRKIKVYLNPVPLLLKKIRIPSIVLLEPRIYAYRSKEGELSLGPVVNAIKSNIEKMQARGSSKFTVLLKGVTLLQGGVIFKDESTGTQASITGLQSSIRVNLSADSATVSVKKCNVRVSAPAYPEVAANSTALIRYDHGRFHLDSLDFVSADAVFSVSGTVGAPPDPELDLKLRVHSGPQTLVKFFSMLKHAKKEQRSRIEASASVQGKLSNPVAEGNLTLSGITYQGLSLNDAGLFFNYRNKHLDMRTEKWKIARGPKTITVDAAKASFGLGSRGLEIEVFDVQAGDLFLSLAGRADPQRGFDAILSADSTGKSQTLSFLTSVPVEGNVHVKGYLTGALNAPLFDGSVSADPVVVRGVQFNDASGGIQFRNMQISLVSVDIHQQTSRYFLNGSIDLGGKEPVLAARLKVIRSDVGNVVALFYDRLPLHFPATGDLSFHGTVSDFTGSARLALDAGSAYGEAFSKGIITAELTKDKIVFPEVNISKGNGTVKGTGWIGFDGTYGASIESRDVRLTEVNLLNGIPLDGLFDFAVQSSGSFSKPSVTALLQMDELSLNQTSMGDLRVALEISDASLTCNARLNDKLIANGKMILSKPYSWSGQANINYTALDPLLLSSKKELAERVKISMNGILSLQGRGGNVSALSGSLSFDKLGISVGDYLVNSDRPASASIKGDRINVSSLHLSGQGTQVSVTGYARFMKEFAFSLSGTGNLSLLRPLFHDLEYSDGIAELSLLIQDSWQKPDVSGELLLKNGEIKLKDFPQKFSALSGKIIFDQTRIIAEGVKGEMGGGTFAVTGKAQLQGLSLGDFSSSASFDNVTLRYPEGLTTTVSGELYYDGNASEQSLNGDIAVKRARYDKRIEWKSMLVDIGKGLHQKKKGDSGPIGNTEINIRFYGKDNIWFQNNLAKMPVDVDIFLRGTLSRLQLLGRIEARNGSVYFRQNEFKVTQASVDFVDPNRVNPVLDIQAEIHVRDYLIRLAVSGTADRAVVTLLSDPQLPDSDILALLALGKTPTELKGKEAGVGMSEAASFATGQFQDMFESRARSLTGLDRFQVDPYVSTGDTSVPRVTVGKEIVQNKLYLTYSSNVGSTTPEQVFRIEYLLNKHFSVVGERNEEGNTGADIKYRFEFR
jgi:autotransporter translocation and assembly factor TamB